MKNQSADPQIEKNNQTLPRVAPGNVKSRQCVTILKSPQEVYEFWRDLPNLKYFMKDISDIQILSATRSKWTVRLKSGFTAEWIAEIVDDKPGELISWRTVEGEVKTEGSVWFSRAPADKGTIVSMAMTYQVPGGKLTELATKMSGEDPDALAITNLKRLKAFLEVGEIATTEGQPSGREEIPETLH